jgi:ectoine hydroxylase-related dioxygenase (phytanoyl-CoA dioxygenase family)
VARVIRSGPIFHARALSSALRLSGLVVVAFIAACSKGSANLAGHWKGVRAEGTKPDVADTQNAYAAHMRVDVDGNTITVGTAKGPLGDHYTVVSEDKTTTVIATSKDGPDDPQTFTFPDAKTMKWQVAPGSVIVFSKE